MMKYYNCRFNVGDIVIGINPKYKRSYLNVFMITNIDSHDEYGREFADTIKMDYRRDNDICTDINTHEVDVKTLNRDYRKINIE